MSDDAGRLLMTLDVDADSPGSPMHYVSAARLAYYQRMEAEALHLRKVVLAVRLTIVSDFSGSEMPNVPPSS